MARIIDPEDCIVLFADLQEDILELSRTNSPATMRKGVAGLAKLACSTGMPFIVTAVATGEAPPTIISEIGDILGVYQPVYRTTADSLRNDQIYETLQRSGRKTILISGVATELAVALPALSGIDHGYKTFVVLDACGGVSERSEKATLSRLAQAGVGLTAVITLVGEFAGEFTEPQGQRLVPLIFEMASA